MPRKRTQEEFDQEMLIKGNKNVKVLTPYIGANDKVKCKCVIDSSHPDWWAKPADLLKGKGCRKCAGKQRAQAKKTDIQEVIFRLNKEQIKIVSGQEHYSNNRSLLKLQCQIHNNEWESCAQNIFRNKINCPICRTICNKITPNSLASKNKGQFHCYTCFQKAEREKQKNAFLNKTKTANPNLIIKNLEEYKNLDSVVKVYCKNCKNTWLLKAESLLANNCTCYNCCASKGEKEISRVLKKYSIKNFIQYKFNDCRDINPLPFDFYLPDYNCCIEYDGEQHFKPVNKFGGEKKFLLQQKHDTIKNNYCIKNNIKLLRISYFEFKNIEIIISHFLPIRKGE